MTHTHYISRLTARIALHQATVDEAEAVMAACQKAGKPVPSGVIEDLAYAADGLQNALVALQKAQLVG